MSPSRDRAAAARRSLLHVTIVCAMFAATASLASTDLPRHDVPRHSALWIVGYPDGSRRLQRTLRVQQPDWLCARCREHGVEERNWDRRSAVNIEVLGLAVVERGALYDGALSDWGAEGNLLFNYYDRSKDCFTYRVIDAVRLVTPLKVFGSLLFVSCVCFACCFMCVSLQRKQQRTQTTEKTQRRCPCA